MFVLLVLGGGYAATSRAADSWLVQAGKTFQRAGNYTTRGDNTSVQSAIKAYGRPSSCRVVGSSNHAVFRWQRRGIVIDAWTYGGMPADENGCISPDLIHISEIRLTSERWRTAFGLRIGDPTIKLRRLYPRARYYSGKERFQRAEYWLVTKHGPCTGTCSAFEDEHGVDSPRLTAQIRNGRVIAFWLPVFGQGE